MSRRHLLLIQTIVKFESHFGYPLWECEREHLADLLKIEKLPSKGLAHDPVAVAQAHPTVKKHRLSDLEMKTAGKYEGDFKEDLEGAIEDQIDGEAQEIEEEETEKVLQWLGEGWESLVSTLRQEVEVKAAMKPWPSISIETRASRRRKRYGSTPGMQYRPLRLS